MYLGNPSVSRDDRGTQPNARLLTGKPPRRAAISCGRFRDDNIRIVRRSAGTSPLPPGAGQAEVHCGMQCHDWTIPDIKEMFFSRNELLSRRRCGNGGSENPPGHKRARRAARGRVHTPSERFKGAHASAPRSDIVAFSFVFPPTTFTCNNLPQNRRKNRRSSEIAPNCRFF